MPAGRWLVYRDWFELVFESLGKSSDSWRKLIFGIIFWEIFLWFCWVYTQQRPAIDLCRMLTGKFYSIGFNISLDFFFDKMYDNRRAFYDIGLFRCWNTHDALCLYLDPEINPAKHPVSILQKSIAGRYRPVRVADGPITARYRFNSMKKYSRAFIKKSIISICKYFRDEQSVLLYKPTLKLLNYPFFATNILNLFWVQIIILIKVSAFDIKINTPKSWDCKDSKCCYLVAGYHWQFEITPDSW